LFALGIAAQQNPAEAPANKEDIKRYFDVMHSREMMTQMIDAMSKPIHQMIHEQFLKEKDKLPADFETRMNHMMDDRMKSFPWDDILQSMVPVYQKHLTKGDVDAMVAFYSGPTGQKLLREMPAITAEAMQSMMPLLQKQLDSLNERMRQEIAAMLKQPSDTQGRKAPPVSN
jgi:uncharacterized protein